jgi:hypothetical protein
LGWGKSAQTSLSPHATPIIRPEMGVVMTKSDIFRQKSDINRTFFGQILPFFALEPPFLDVK